MRVRPSLRPRGRRSWLAAHWQVFAWLAVVVATLAWAVSHTDFSDGPARLKMLIQLRIQTSDPEATPPLPPLAAQLRSHYAKFVRSDFEPWLATGISKEMVTAAANMHWSYQVSSVRCLGRAGAAGRADSCGQFQRPAFFAALPVQSLSAAREAACPPGACLARAALRVVPLADRRFQIINGVLWAVFPKHSLGYSRGYSPSK